MGWCIRYNGPAATIDVPSRGEVALNPGDVIDLPVIAAREVLAPADTQFERIRSGDPDYVAPEDRT